MKKCLSIFSFMALVLLLSSLTIKGPSDEIINGDADIDETLAELDELANEFQEEALE